MFSCKNGMKKLIINFYVVIWELEKDILFMRVMDSMISKDFCLRCYDNEFL